MKFRSTACHPDQNQWLSRRCLHKSIPPWCGDRAPVDLSSIYRRFARAFRLYFAPTVRSDSRFKVVKCQRWLTIVKAHFQITNQLLYLAELRGAESGRTRGSTEAPLYFSASGAVSSFITAASVGVLGFVTFWSKRKELLVFYGVAIRGSKSGESNRQFESQSAVFACKSTDQTAKHSALA
jgi:hypothetical protein